MAQERKMGLCLSTEAEKNENLGGFGSIGVSTRLHTKIHPELMANYVSVVQIQEVQNS